MRTFGTAVLVQVVLDAGYRSCCSVNSVKSTERTQRTAFHQGKPQTDFILCRSTNWLLIERMLHPLHRLSDGLEGLLHPTISLKKRAQKNQKYSPRLLEGRRVGNAEFTMGRICVEASFRWWVQRAEVMNESAGVTLTAAFHSWMRCFICVTQSACRRMLESSMALIRHDISITDTHRHTTCQIITPH